MVLRLISETLPTSPDPTFSSSHILSMLAGDIVDRKSLKFYNVLRLWLQIVSVTS